MSLSFYTPHLSLKNFLLLFKSGKFSDWRCLQLSTPPACLFFFFPAKAEELTVKLERSANFLPH